jgi:hypothetical protein
VKGAKGKGRSKSKERNQPTTIDSIHHISLLLLVHSYSHTSPSVHCSYLYALFHFPQYTYQNNFARDCPKCLTRSSRESKTLRASPSSRLPRYVYIHRNLSQS